jgi:hypothetical protein
VGIEGVEDLCVGLQRYQHGFCGRHTARASKTVCQGNLRWWKVLGLDFVLRCYFVGVLRIEINPRFCERPQAIGKPTSASFALFCGRVSTGLIQATPGEMKSFKSSADKIALMVAGHRFWSFQVREPRARIKLDQGQIYRAFLSYKE